MGDGITVTDDTIYLGLLADLTGPFSGQVVDVVDAQIAFWEKVNDAGGIDGRKVELLIADTGYDVDTTVAKYQELMPRVVLFAHVTGSQQMLAIADRLVADDRLAIPLTWYSGWSDPVIGRNVLEVGTNYCVEAINTIDYLVSSFRDELGRAPRVAIATVPDDYGGDSAAGAQYAIQALGAQLVYDGVGALVPGEDISPVVAGISRSRADLTWISTDPITFATVMAGAIQLGYTGQWSGASPTFNSRLLDTALGEVVGNQVVVPLVAAPLGAEVPGMAEVYRTLADTYPDRYPSDALVTGYLEFAVARQLLEKAADLGDLTPAGVVAASAEIGSFSYQGIAPPNLYTADPNLSVSRASGIGKLDKGRFDRQGGLAARMGDGAVSALDIVEPFAASDLATAYDFTRPCYQVGSP